MGLVLMLLVSAVAVPLVAAQSSGTTTVVIDDFEDGANASWDPSITVTNDTALTGEYSGTFAGSAEAPTVTVGDTRQYDSFSVSMRYDSTTTSGNATGFYTSSSAGGADYMDVSVVADGNGTGTVQYYGSSGFVETNITVQRGDWYTYTVSNIDVSNNTATLTVTDATGTQVGQTQIYAMAGQDVSGWDQIAFWDENAGSVYVDDITVDMQDADGDGIADQNDAYTGHVPRVVEHTNDDNMTPDSAYAEFNTTGDVTVTVEAYSPTANEYQPVSETTVTISNASSDSPEVREFDLTNHTGADKYRLTVHGMDASDTGIFYETTSSGGAAGTSSSDGIVSALMNTTIFGVPISLIGALLVVGGAVVLLNREGPRR
jgi:hypothetical protein